MNGYVDFHSGILPKLNTENTDAEVEKCVEILKNLGFELLGQNVAAAKFKTPSFRINDVKQEVDLIEEIARIYGYDKIAPTLPKKTQSPEVSKEHKLLKSINNLFLGFGFNEAMTSSLIGEPLLNQFGFHDITGRSVCK